MKRTIHRGFRTVVHAGKKLRLSIPKVKYFVRIGWIYYCGCNGCKYYHCSYTQAGRLVDLEMLKNYFN